MGKMIQFGAMAPALHEQFNAPPPEPGSLAAHWQKDVDAISRLAVRGLITDSEARNARGRFIKRMKREHDEANKDACMTRQTKMPTPYESRAEMEEGEPGHDPAVHIARLEDTVDMLAEALKSAVVLVEESYGDDPDHTWPAAQLAEAFRNG